MKKMLFVQNVQVAPQKPNKKSEKKRKKLKGKYLILCFVELKLYGCWYRLISIYCRFLSKRIATEKPI